MHQTFDVTGVAATRQEHLAHTVAPTHELVPAPTPPVVHGHSGPIGIPDHGVSGPLGVPDPGAVDATAIDSSLDVADDGLWSQAGDAVEDVLDDLSDAVDNLFE